MQIESSYGNSWKRIKRSNSKEIVRLYFYSWRINLNFEKLFSCWKISLENEISLSNIFYKCTLKSYNEFLIRYVPLEFWLNFTVNPGNHDFFIYNHNYVETLLSIKEGNNLSFTPNELNKLNIDLFAIFNLVFNSVVEDSKISNNKFHFYLGINGFSKSLSHVFTHLLLINIK